MDLEDIDISKYRSNCCNSDMYLKEDVKRRSDKKIKYGNVTQQGERFYIYFCFKCGKQTIVRKSFMKRLLSFLKG